MKVEILYPFIDFRRLRANKIDSLLQKPHWPKRPNGNLAYYRSMGQVYPKNYYIQPDKNKNYTPSCIANGVRLKDASIKGLKGINRVIDLNYGNDMLGFYSISFFIKVGTFNDMTVEDVYEYFKEVKFNVVDLVDHHKDLGMENLKGYLCEQYYWATRRLVNWKTREKIYERDPNTLIKGVKKIFIPEQKFEMNDIHFLKPYFILEYTNDDKLKSNCDKFPFIPNIKCSVSLEQKKRMNVIEIERPFYDKKDVDFKKFSNYTNNLKYNFLLFDYLANLSKYTWSAVDDTAEKKLVEDYFEIIEKTYSEAYYNGKLKEIKKIYERYSTNFLNDLIHNLDSFFGNNSLSKTLDGIHNCELTPN